MSEEETIEYLKIKNKVTKQQIDNGELWLDTLVEAEKKDIVAIDTVLKALEKKDKIIDLMAEMLRYYNGMKQEQCFCIDICKNKNCDENNCFYRIKEYFIKLVEDK